MAEGWSTNGPHHFPTALFASRVDTGMTLADDSPPPGPIPDHTGREHALGRWQPGQSGNPSGRPRGSRDRALAALDAIGDANAADILQAVVDAAKGGDMRAAELLLSRLWPIRRGRPIAVALPPVATAADLPGALGAVIAAMAGGEISADEAASMAGVLEAQRKALETANLEARIESLERSTK